MADYRRLPQHFDHPGQTTRPRDMAPPGRQQLIENLRPYTPGTLEVRAGLRQLTSGPASSAIHSLARINDSVSGNQSRVVGAGSNLYAAAAADPQALGTAADSGYSGDPLSFVAVQPVQSPSPFLYVADRSRQRKLSPSRTVYPIGLAPPTGPPAAVVVRPGKNVIDLIDTTSHWSAAGAAAGSVSSISRVSTTVSSIVYDYLPASFTVATTGPAAIIPASALDLTEGMLVTIDSELTIVEQILIKIASTTIATIVYDSGTTGPCSIYPTASLGTGQLESPPLDVYRTRYHIPNPPPLFSDPSSPAGIEARIAVASQAGATQTLANRPNKRIRQVDFPIGCLVNLGGTEVVPILSVAVNSDGFQSFRCVTTSAHSAGEAITGVGPGFRCNLAHTVTAGGAITAGALRHTITPDAIAATDGPTAVTGGIQRGATINLSMIESRATLSDDYLRFFVTVDRLHDVKAIRLYLDCNPSPQDFLQNYFVFEWRANDLIAAIQATNTGATATFESVTVESIILRDRARAAALGASFKITQAYLDRVTALVNDQTFQQLALGDKQWVKLECKISQLTRVGTDTSRTLADILAAQILVVASTQDPLQVDYQGLYLTGGYGPDIGQVGDPYVYRYRYRSTLTGEVSNPSPVTRSSYIARRQAIDLYATASTDAQADTLDWFRLGSSLTRWTYVNSSPNTTSPYRDTYPDGAIDGGEGLSFDDFQPWPVLDTRKMGTCTVAGNAIKRTAGDTFDTRWAPGTRITVNGLSVTLDQVISTSVLLTAENAGTGTGLTFIVPEPQLLAQPLPAIWTADDTGVLFACGDTKNPGTVYWTKPSNPDVTSDANSLTVTSPSDPLQNGWTWDGRIYVASTRDIYELRQSSPGVWEAVLTASGKGLWAKWAFAVAPDGVYFLADDGIYRTQGGSIAQSLTDADLYDLFPHDGLPGRGSSGGVEAPDLSQTARLRLAYVDGLVYFDYASTAGHDRTLIFDTTGDGGGWIQDNYTGGGVQTRLPELGLGIHNQIAARNTHLAVFEGHQDFGATIAWTWQSADIDGGDPRLVKQWGDAILDADLKGDTATITPIFNHGATTLTPFTRTGSGRTPLILDIADGAGQLARSMGLYVTGSTSTNPVLFLWEPAALLKAEDITRRATDWDDLGTPGAKFIQGILIRANTYGAQKTFLVQGDGSTALTLNINQSGEKTVAYPIASTGWTPFIAHLVRLWPSGDDDPFQLYSLQWVFEPAPELASEWTTQPTTHDFPGYLHVRDGFVSYSDATQAITMEIVYDGVSYSTVITPASTAYHRDYIILPPAKGRSVSYRWTSTAPFRLYQRDISVRAHAWGGGEYTVVQPFGGPSRTAGAQI